MGAILETTPLRATSANMPELCVEWLPTLGPGASDGEWADITEYVTAGSTSRGRDYELDAFSAGTCTITLESFSRLFDPENTAGPFFPWLNVMRQIRVSAVYGGTRYPIFRGYITDWGQTVDAADKKFSTTITAHDGFERLEQYQLPSSAWALEVQKLDPSMWLRLGETDTTRVTDSSPGGNYGIYDNCQQGVPGLIANDQDGAVAFSHSTEERVYIQNPNLITGYPFSISAMFKIDSLPTSLPVLFSCWPSAPAVTRGYLLIALDYVLAGSGLAGHLYVQLGDGTNSSDIISSVASDDNQVHHMVWTATNSSTWQLLIDGVDVGLAKFDTPGASSWLSAQPAHWVIGNYTDLDVGDFGFGTNVGDGALNSAGVAGNPGTIDEFVVWNGTAITAAQVATLYAATTGWDGDDTGTRVSRFLDAIGWPTNLRDIDTGISILGPSNWSAGTNALSALQAWADTELGLFLMGTNGELIWRSRHSPLIDTNAMVSQATFSDTHDTHLHYDDIALPRDATLIRNPVTASRRDGIAVTVSDDALIDDKYGARAWAAPNSEDNLDSTVRDRAMWLLGRYKEQGTRLASMKLSPTEDPTNLFPEVLGRTIGDRITVLRTPLGANAQTSLGFIVEGVAHTFAPFAWETEYRGAHVDPNVGSYLILDDTTFGLLDSALLAY